MHLRNFLLVNFQHVPEIFRLSSWIYSIIRLQEFKNCGLTSLMLIFKILICFGWSLKESSEFIQVGRTCAWSARRPTIAWRPFRLSHRLSLISTMLSEYVQPLNCLKSLLSQATLHLRIHHETFGWITSSSTVPTFRFLLLFHIVDF